MDWKQAFDEPFVNVSNLLSVLRVLLLPPFVYASFEYLGQPGLFWLGVLVGLAALAALTDFLDGFLARILHQETIVGRYLDPICDKLVILGAMTLLVLYFDFPPYIYGFYILREILGVWMGTFLYFKRDRQARPNIFGKVAVGVAAIVTVWYYAIPYLRTKLDETDWRLDPTPAAWGFVLIHILGMIGYARSYGKIILAKNPAQ